ncbi:MAG: hypothetical protein KME03_05465 [Aphanocapsa lilacina HA4352-LM1]|nr:hypothetical protein [Aphanocapsa lilacina HA4352-LM1]
MRSQSIETVRRLRRLFDEFARQDCRCALIEGSPYIDSLPARLGAAAVLHPVSHLVKVESVAAGLFNLERLLVKKRFDLVILHELPCSLARVRTHLARTPGQGKVLWIRQNDIHLLDEYQTRPSSWTVLSERFGPKLEQGLKFLDRWEIR